jgi:uncharacterized protein YbjQ (UPF0145 family)
MSEEQPSAHPYRSGVEATHDVLVTTGNDVAGHRIERYLGIVRGIVVRSPSFGKSFVGAFKSLRGGNIREFTEVCEAARHEAFEQMLDNARSLRADAVIAVRYDATEFMQGTTEVLVYGTAVRLLPETR